MSKEQFTPLLGDRSPLLPLLYLGQGVNNSERGKRKDWKNQRRGKINVSKEKGVFSAQFS